MVEFKWRDCTYRKQQEIREESEAPSIIIEDIPPPIEFSQTAPSSKPEEVADVVSVVGILLLGVLELLIRPFIWISLLFVAVVRELADGEEELCKFEQNAGR